MKFKRGERVKIERSDYPKHWPKTGKIEQTKYLGIPHYFIIKIDSINASSWEKARNLRKI